MKIYKIAFRNHFEIASNIMSEKLLHMIKDLYESKRLFSQTKWTKNTIAKYKGFLEPLDININIDVFHDKKSFPSYNIKGMYKCDAPLFDQTAESKNRSMIIYIIIFGNFSQKDYNSFYQSAVNVIRHELEHLDKDQQRKRYRPSYNVEKMMNNKGTSATEQAINRFEEMAKYLADKAEQEAMIKGILLYCKKQKIPIMRKIREFIRGNLFIDPQIERAIKNHFGLQAEHIEQILIDLYAKRIKELYPHIDDKFLA